MSDKKDVMGVATITEDAATNDKEVAAAVSAASKMFLQTAGASAQEAIKSIAGVIGQFASTELDGKRPFAVAALQSEIERIVVNAHNRTAEKIQAGKQPE